PKAEVQKQPDLSTLGGRIRAKLQQNSRPNIVSQSGRVYLRAGRSGSTCIRDRPCVDKGRVADDPPRTTSFASQSAFYQWNPSTIRRDKTYRQPSVWAGIIYGTVALISGARLGPYEIVSLLGAGGTGEVYRAKDTRLGREVAIKVLPDHLSGNALALARFERESKVLAALSHPNILAIFDVGQASGVSFVVMELLPGETLRSRI